MTRRQQEIIDQAMALIVEEGIGGLTMKKIARRMGFSEPALYRHFQNKEDLVVALIHRIRARYEGVIGDIDREWPPERFLEGFLCPLLAYLEEVRGVTMLFLSESTYNRKDMVRGALYQLYNSMVAALSDYLTVQKARGTVRPNVDVTAGAILLMGAVQSLTIRYVLSGERLALKDKCMEIIDIFLRGVAV